jgi:hypothetical protein
VEADQETVNVTRFSLFFPEKRQFFTESAGLFNYGKPGVENGVFGAGLLPLFYSRRIGLYESSEVPLLAGARVTGRAGPYSIGAMNIQTDSATVGSGDSRTLVDRANYSVLRLKRDILSQSNVGVIILNREGGPGADFNRTAGVDLNLAFGRNTRLTGMLAKTFSPDVTSGDVAGAVDLAYQRDKYYYDLTYLDVGRHFNAEMGYIQRVDTRNPRVSAGWTPRPGWRGIRQLTFGGVVDTYATHGGTLESRTSTGVFGVTFDDTSAVVVNVIHDYDLLATPFSLGNGVVPIGGFAWSTTRASYTPTPRRRVGGTGFIETGSYYNGNKITGHGELNLLPLDTLMLELAYTRNRITLPLASFYLTNTVSSRLSYSFSPTLFVKAYAQYNDAKKLASFNLLLWSICRLGSDLHIVYNQGWNTDVEGPRAVQVKNRSLSVKFTYWLSR